MNQVIVTGPDHSKKDSILFVIASVLRAAGAEVNVIGEQSFLSDKALMELEDHAENLSGLKIHLTKQRTAAPRSESIVD